MAKSRKQSVSIVSLSERKRHPYLTLAADNWRDWTASEGNSR